MNRAIKIIGIVLMAYLFIAIALPNAIGVPLAAWNSYQAWKETENAIIIKRGSTEELEKIVAKNMKGESDLNPEIALKSIVELYQNTKDEVVESNENPIDIYVIYGTDYWKEYAETFEIIFAHQKVDQNDGNLYEYRIDIIYDPTDFKGIEEFSVGYDSTMDIEDFKNSAIKSIGFQKAFKIEPRKIEIIKEQI